MVCRRFIVWDFPWPLELDARPWRCRTCQNRRGQQGHHYFRVTDADVLREVPEALVINSRRAGKVFVTVPFLVQLLACLYEELSFRAARRRLIDIFLASSLILMRPGKALT